MSSLHNFCGIIGNGVVGSALQQFFMNLQYTVHVYDKYKSPYNDELHQQNLLLCPILFICLPTNLNKQDPFASYDLQELNETLEWLASQKYPFPIVIKSTLLPHTTDTFQTQFPTLHLFHCPEFLSERTAVMDCYIPKQIIIGKPRNGSASATDYVSTFFHILYPTVNIAIVNAVESEATKLFCNSFYAVKIQLFHEFYQYCETMEINFEMVKMLMINQGWIHPMHTTPNSSRTFGGRCLPKDLMALYGHCQSLASQQETQDPDLPSHKRLKFDIVDACVNEHKMIQTENELLEPK